MDQQKRLFLALGLSFGLIFVYSLIFPPTPPPNPAEKTTANTVDAGTVAALPAPAPSVAAAPAADAGVAAELPPVVNVIRNSPTTRRTFTSAGGALTRAELQGKKMREQTTVSIAEGYRRFLGKETDDAPQMDMGRPVPGAPLPLSISIDGAQPLAADARYRAEEGAEDATQVVFRASVSGWDVEKKVEWDGAGYEYRYTVALKNTGSQAVSGELAFHSGRYVDHTKEEAPNFFGGVGNQARATCRVGEDNHSLVDPKDDTEDFKGPVRFWGIDQQYFLAALYPLSGPMDGRCVLKVHPEGRTATAYFPINIAAGQSVTYQMGVYIGPKDMELIGLLPTQAPPGVSRVPAQLEQTVDYGIWAVICRLLLTVLKFFYSVIHNWGVAIILLTVLVKVVLLPLTHKSMVSAEQMKKLQPKMEELKKKYPDDRERQSMEMMKLYQQEKVNPLGGCIPLLLQLPVWAALFTMLRNSFELYREPFIVPLWLDLTYKDPTYLLPIALGVTMIITQKMQPQMMDAAQARMMTYVMPVFFTAIMLNYPSGLSLYILTNNLITIVQQKALRRYLEHKGIAERPAPREKDVKKRSGGDDKSMKRSAT
jgi:YidC/Oxa1 family membrane protein insertase